MTTATHALVAQLDAILPQTQCGQCGFDGCRPYATALAAGEADIDRCPPGGDEGAQALALLLHRTPRPVDPHYGPPKRRATRVVIDESICIGCTKCIQACPVDAIVGAQQQMHTVIAAECTGCDLCIPPCPVDCIAVVPVGEAVDYRAHVEAQRPLAYRRHHARRARLARLDQEQAHSRAQRRAAIEQARHAQHDEVAENTTTATAPAIIATGVAADDDPVARALATARARRASRDGGGT